MDLDHNSARGTKLAPLVQVALAAVVAGSMLMFSALAFRTGILDDGSGGVRPTTRSADNGRPVVLPAATAEPEVAGRRERRGPDRILVSELDPGTDVVLGKTITSTDDTGPKADPSDRNPSGRDHKDRNHKDRDRKDRDHKDRNHGDGHDKAKGKGHHKGNGKGHHENVEAKEDDDDWDGHGSDDDDGDDDSSNSGSGSRQGSSGHSGGSGSNSSNRR